MKSHFINALGFREVYTLYVYKSKPAVYENKLVFGEKLKAKTKITPKKVILCTRHFYLS